MHKNVAPLPYAAYISRLCGFLPEADQFRGRVGCSTDGATNQDYFEFHCADLRPSAVDAMRDAAQLLFELDANNGKLDQAAGERDSVNDRVEFTMTHNNEARPAYISRSALDAMDGPHNHGLLAVFSYNRAMIAQAALAHWRTNPLNATIVLGSGDF
jgi:hypothetical protein